MIRIASRLALLLSLVASAALLPASSPLVAGSGAPSINDLSGLWAIELSYSGSELSSGASFKEKAASIYELSNPSENVIRLLDTFKQQEIFGRYVNGFLLIGQSDAPTALGTVPTESQSYVIRISGTAPRLKGKGVGVEYETGGDFAASAKVKMAKIQVQ
ncbi:MAG: hypothetical protein JNM84_00205 [Planctomycetes bacterium]|nr:hypothetical protein [Planctomycetota bacterium]